MAPAKAIEIQMEAERKRCSRQQRQARMNMATHRGGYARMNVSANRSAESPPRQNHRGDFHLIEALQMTPRAETVVPGAAASSTFGRRTAPLDDSMGTSEEARIAMRELKEKQAQLLRRHPELANDV